MKGLITGSAARRAGRTGMKSGSLVTMAGALCIIAITIAAATTLPGGVAGNQARQVPLFEVDPFWPKPLPDHWLLGSTVGVAVDTQDRVWVLNRTDSFNRRTEIGAATDPPTGECCVPAPAVLAFSAEGDLLSHWAGAAESADWPRASQRLTPAADGTVWIGGVGDGDVGIRRFSADGRFVATAGAPAPAADAAVHDGLVFTADAAGRAVRVLDAASGDMVRSWGAYGRPANAGAAPGDYEPGAPPAQQFRNVHCVELSRDGFVHVCDRESNRIQVFRTDGTYVSETVIMPETLGEGAVWDIAFSADAEQAFIYVADGSNMRVHVLDRASLEVLTSFGTGGRQPGQFHALHSIATDSRGNVYTGETYEGKRVQKFVFRGLGPAPAADQGPLWPRR